MAVGKEERRQSLRPLSQFCGSYPWTSAHQLRTYPKTTRKSLIDQDTDEMEAASFVVSKIKTCFKVYFSKVTQSKPLYDPMGYLVLPITFPLAGLRN